MLASCRLFLQVSLNAFRSSLFSFRRWVFATIPQAFSSSRCRWCFLHLPRGSRHSLRYVVAGVFGISSPLVSDTSSAPLQSSARRPRAGMPDLDGLATAPGHLLQAYSSLTTGLPQLYFSHTLALLQLYFSHNLAILQSYFNPSLKYVGPK